MALNEEQQTEAIFKSVRTDVDPVSGNEVPPGSLPEEVRDDIPAMLSEGEYVVPADVLRFYGMKFFEDLRQQAKMGLADMEANGRIGGEPVEGPAMGGEELTPEEMAEIESMVMAVGGFVPQNTQSTQPDPYMQQQTMYNTGAPVAMGNAGYNEGGTVPAETQAPLNYADRFAAGFTFTEPTETQPTADQLRVVTLYGPSGEVETLTLPTQQVRYDELVALGYRETQVQTTTETTVGQQDTASDKSDRDTDIDLDRGPAISEMNGTQLDAAQQQIDFIKQQTSNLPGKLGLIAKGAAYLQQKQIDKRVEELGLEPTVTDSTGRTTGPSYATQDVAGIATAKAMTPEQVQAGIEYAERGDDRDTTWQGGQVASNQDRPDEDRSAEQAQEAAQKAAEDLGVGLATGGR